jgi:hypothetical protein
MIMQALRNTRPCPQGSDPALHVTCRAHTIFRKGSKPRSEQCPPADGYQVPSLPYTDPVRLIRRALSL